MTVEPNEISLSVSDLVLAKLAAQAAVSVPGVRRLAPRLTKVVQSALTRVARSLTNTTTPDQGAADPGAVEIERSAAGPVIVTVRIIATGDPGILQTADAVAAAVYDALSESAAAEVVVIVVDAESGH